VVDPTVPEKLSEVGVTLIVGPAGDVAYATVAQSSKL
jgi:hypothetical protein